jgi:carbon monoxide dehydrogenase subunit G
MASPIEETRVVHAPPEPVFAFLSVLDNHWDLMGSCVERLESSSDGTLVKIHGPLGVKRTARTCVVRVEPPRLMTGSAQLSSGARGSVTWELEPSGQSTSVRLSATIVAAGPRDRIAFALGGRQWLRRRFDYALAELAGRFTPA